MRYMQHITYFRHVFCTVLLISSHSLSGTPRFKGQASASLAANSRNDQFLGVRYIPSVEVTRQGPGPWQWDGLFTFNGYADWQGQQWRFQDNGCDITPYRVWIRLASDRFGIRAGKQKINFGPAQLIRPLMWFDSLDPRDPLQMTDGVYAVLARYYFLNNANLWLWGLYGNDRIKGLEMMPTSKYKTEYGGRFQHPLGPGEIGLTFHHRIVSGDISLAEFVVPELPPDFSVGAFPENRYAVDGRWDHVIGFWFEASLTHQDKAILPVRFMKMMTIGGDYTFSAGNGLYVQAEHFFLRSSYELTGHDEGADLSALAVRYPVSLLDNLNVIFYYDWNHSDLYCFASWQRQYDRWSFYFMGFCNPEQFNLIQFQTARSLFLGRGFQVMAVFNH